MIKSKVDEMSVKEAVTYAMGQLIAQGGKCTETPTSQSCVYGNDKGQHCLVGWLLDHTDEMLMAAEGTVQALTSDYADEVPEMLYDNMQLFSDLQAFHDDTGSPFKDKRRQLKNLKRDYPEIVDLRNPVWKQWVEITDGNL